MRQLQLNILLSMLVLGATVIVAAQGAPNARASESQLPAIFVDAVADGSVQLHGYGFRPGSLVTLSLKPREGSSIVATTNASEVRT